MRSVSLQMGNSKIVTYSSQRQKTQAAFVDNINGGDL